MRVLIWIAFNSVLILSLAVAVWRWRKVLLAQREVLTRQVAATTAIAEIMGLVPEELAPKEERETAAA